MFADLIWAAELGARVAARVGRARGLDDHTVRGEIVGRLRSEFHVDGDDYPLARLIEAAERGVSEVFLTPPMTR